MAIFDIMTRAPKHLMEAGDDIHTRYFTIDTADLITFYEWYAHNPYIVTYAISNGETIGYYNVIPITTECAQMFDEQAIKEEDMRIEHILSADVMEHAQHVYLASIAIRDRNSYLSRQCVAAMICAIADNLLNGYDIGRLKRVYANPTTFDGNRMVRKLGLTPVVSYKKPLKGNDIYALDLTPENIVTLRKMADRYRRLIGTNSWAGKAGA